MSSSIGMIPYILSYVFYYCGLFTLTSLFTYDFLFALYYFVCFRGMHLGNYPYFRGTSPGYFKNMFVVLYIAFRYSAMGGFYELCHTTGREFLKQTKKKM